MLAGLSLVDDRVKLKAAAADDTDDTLPNSDLPGVVLCWSKPCLKRGPELVAPKPENGDAAVVLFMKGKGCACAGAGVAAGTGAAAGTGVAAGTVPGTAAGTAAGNEDTAVEMGMSFVVETAALLSCSGVGDLGGVTSS